VLQAPAAAPHLNNPFCACLLNTGNGQLMTVSVQQRKDSCGW
jgi:hypothetical protein